MFELKTQTYASKREHYAELVQQARGLLHGERDLIANAANFGALVYHSLAGLSWAGFYLFDGTELVVGPFQGKPACIRIALGRGVCGTAATTRQTQVVQDVNAFAARLSATSPMRCGDRGAVACGGQAAGGASSKSSTAWRAASTPVPAVAENTCAVAVRPSVVHCASSRARDCAA